MEPSCSSEANSRSCSQEISLLLLNSKVHYRVHKTLPLVLLLSQMHPVLTSPPRFLKICSNIMLCMLRSSEGCRLIRFSTKILYIFLVSSMHATLAAVVSNFKEQVA